MFELLDDYKNELSAYGLVFQHTRKRWRWFWTVLWLFAASAGVLIISAVTRHVIMAGWSLGIAIIILAVCASLFLKLNREAKRIVKERYGIDSTEFLWNSREFVRYRRKLLRNWLLAREYLSAEKLDLLIGMLKNHAARQRFSDNWFWGALGVIIIPLWVQILQVVSRAVHTMIYALALLGICAVLAVPILIVVAMVRVMYFDIKHQKYRQTMDLIEGLEDIRLNI